MVCLVFDFVNGRQEPVLIFPSRNLPPSRLRSLEPFTWFCHCWSEKETLPCSATRFSERAKGLQIVSIQYSSCILHRYSTWICTILFGIPCVIEIKNLRMPIVCLENTIILLLLLVLREYWMIYRGPGFLAVVWFGSSHTPTPSSVAMLDRRHTGSLRKRDGRGGREDHTIGRTKPGPL